MNNPLRIKRWSPFAVGAGLGVLSWFAFWSAQHPLGITTAFEHTAAILLHTFTGGAFDEHAYFQQVQPKIGWEWMLVLGVFLGSLLSAAWSGDREAIVVPKLWAERFGNRRATRLVAAFFAAGLMMFGARLANGCTSGHGISGNLQLAASSWIFSVTFFVVAIVTAMLVLRPQK